MVESALIQQAKGFFRQTVRAGIILLGVSAVTFVMIELVPGDPAEMILSAHTDAVSAEKIEILRRELGLDLPLPIRWLQWLKGIICLDMGNSFRTGDPVFTEIRNRLPVTLTLALGAFVFAVTASLAGGILSAVFQNRFPDRAHRAWTILAVSIPDYWLGLILLLFFSLKLQWFPVTGNEGFKAFVLPILTLGLSVSASEGRVFRAGILEVLSQDYVRFAHAKGLGPAKIFIGHVFRAAVLPMISLWGMLLGHLLGGAVIAESVFSLPGLGKLSADAVLNRDIPMIQGTVLTMTFFFVISTRIMDGLHALLIPRSAAH
ncbi:MAG: ABC transporter permease [Desulfobacterales bacterium]